MNPIADAIRAHIAETGKSMRALSLELGQGEKFIADILSGKSKRPTPEALERLSEKIGVDLRALPVNRQITVADMIERLRKDPPTDWSASRIRGTISALGWYAKNSSAAGPEHTILDRPSMRSFLSGTTAAAQGVEPNSFSTYASHLRDVADLVARTGRPLQIRDVTGPWRQAYDQMSEHGFTEWDKGLAGPFLAWCSGQGIGIRDVVPETFQSYLNMRLTSGKLTASEAKHRKVAMEVHRLWNRLATQDAYRDLGMRAVASPFGDDRNRYGMPPELLEPLLAEFDRHVVPWVRGETAPDGTPVDVILDRLSPVQVTSGNCKLAQAKKYIGKSSRTGRKDREARLSAAGVLLSRAQWQYNTVRKARAGIKSLAMALWSQTGVVLESIEELTDPELAEAAATALDEMTDEEGIGSSYVESVLKKVKKLAGGYVGRSAEEVMAISSLISDFKPDFAGIAPRNRRKLQQLTPERIDRFLALSEEIVAEVNRQQKSRRSGGRKSRKRKSAEGNQPRFDADPAAQLEVALAHDIMLARAPRTANLLCIDLAHHVRRRADGGITIELPPDLTKTKMRLEIPLGTAQSKFFDAYVEHVRPALMTPVNAGNTHLFPARRSPHGHYTMLTKKLVDTVHHRVGMRIHPHLYRHIVGWIWLKEDPNALPAVQKLLGHKRLETTMQFYAELDETLTLQHWADQLERKSDERNSRVETKYRGRGKPAGDNSAAA